MPQQHQHSSTSLTLLFTLRSHPADESAWNRFAERYQPLIMQWCLHKGLNQNDARDVSQEVMLRMARFIRHFEHDQKQSFRSWLKTVTHNAWHDWAKKEQKFSGGHNDEHLLYSLEGRDDLVERIESEHNSELLELAMLRVQLRVSEPVWRAFELSSLHGLDVAIVADQLNMESARIYGAKSRVIKFLREEIQRLESN